MDEKSLSILEFPQIRQILAGYTAFSASRELALGLVPLTDAARITQLLQHSAEARRLLALEANFGIGSISDIREAVHMAARGKVLDPLALIQVQQTLAAVRELRQYLKQLAEGFPLLWDIASRLVELRPIEKRIGSCIGPAGELLDSASPRLATIRHQLRESRQQVLDQLDAMMKSPRGRKIVQEPLVTEREGRYVIPVKIEFRKEIKGIVHDVSNTEATVFVEPWTTVELGNTVRELAVQEKHETERVLAALSAEIGTHELEIAVSISLAAELDLALAKARYARVVRGAEPIIAGPATLKLVEARHPLLGAKAVPLSVEIGKDFTVLVITGPNTGGKTVAMKTIGLLSAMAQAGMPIPAAPESQIPVFDGIFADIGDEQSIEQTLSSFSWHIGNINRILREATGKSLVLLDELGTSTDPAEGSALARAILLHFLARGVLTVATTHFGDLKAFAHVTKGMQNASLDFDPATLAPTYHLLVGIPGGSNALVTASRLGLPADIIEKARGMLSKGSQELEDVLSSLMVEKTKLQNLSVQLEQEKAEARQQKEALQKELEKHQAEERQALQETRDRLASEAAELHKEIRQAAADLRRDKSKERVEQAKKTLAAVREKLGNKHWQVPGESIRAESIAVGDTVRLREANLTATVLAVSAETQEAEVEAGQIKLKLGLDSMEKVTPSGVIVSVPAPVRKTVSRKAVAKELDLRGKRAEVIEPEVDSYLNDAFLAGLGEVRIIHGFGTGTVRRIVRDFLASHPLVKSFRTGAPKEGGDGATVVRL